MSSRPTLLLASPVLPLGAAKKLRRLCVGFAIGILLAGCAAERTYQDGKDLIAQDQVEQGLAKFQQAMLQDPHNLEYKQAYLQTRERAVSKYLEQADRLAGQGPSQRDEAEKLYRHALALNPNSERAQAGLRNLEMNQRHEQLLKQANLAIEKKDFETAKAKLATILTENPNHEAARALQHSITEENAAPPESLLSAAYKKNISIEFRDVALKQIFEVISRTSGLNFLFDKDVKTDQKTSIFLKNSTIESAVYFMLLTNQLEQQVLDGNTILIYPNTAAKLKDYQKMVVRSFFLTNADAKAVAATLKTILKSRDIVVDEKLNMLIVRDSPEAIKLAEKLVALHDIAEPEVMLEVEILEVSRTKLLDLGIQWPGSLSLTPLPIGTTFDANSTTDGTTTGSSTGTTNGMLSLHDLKNQNSRTIGATIGPVTLNANQQDADVNLLANPRIRVRNHEKAKILIGERVPNITTTATSSGFVSESINYIDVGLTLNVEPTIYLDNEVAIKVGLEVSSIGSQVTTQSGSIAYQIGTRNANTVLRLKDGENQVLAGLINDEDRRSANKVPGLGELPLLGRLFGSTTNNNQKTEIVLSITPHLVRNIQRPDAAQAEFPSGTDSNFRVRADVPGRTVNAAQFTASVPATPAAEEPAAAPGLPQPQPVAPADTGNAGTTSMPTGASTGGAAAGAVANTPAGDSAVSSQGAQLQWQAPAQTRVGQTFTVQLLMQSDQPVTDIPITLGFDKNILQVVRVAEGNFLKQSGAQTSFTSQIDPSGRITINNARSGTLGATGSGTLALINFRALAAADATQIQVLSTAPSDAAGRAIAVVLPAPQTEQVQP